MVSIVRRFLNDKRGTSFEGIALSVSIVAVSFVASADMLDYLTKKQAHPDIVAVKPAAAPIPAAGEIDYTPTASLPRVITRSVLDPCTGAVR